MQQTFTAESARVQAIRALESYLTVRAPSDGTITACHVHPGALVALRRGDRRRQDLCGVTPGTYSGPSRRA